MIKYSRLLVKGDNRLDLPDTSGRTVLHLAAMIQVHNMLNMFFHNSFNRSFLKFT